MIIKAPSGSKFRVVNFLEGNHSFVQTSLIRGSIFVTMILMAVPLRVVREIVYGSPQNMADLKASLRSLIWLWNRSWIPIKHEMGTFFDIGWYLTTESCRDLVRKQFISKKPLKRKCDLAQLKLSIIRDCVESGDGSKLAKADEEVVALVSSVLNDAHQWALFSDVGDDHPVQVSSKANGTVAPAGKDFDDESTRSVLIDFDDLCAALGQEYFLVSGTYLGVVRDGAFIGHDHDIDVGVFEDQLLEELLPALWVSDKFVVNKVDHICVRKVDDNGIRYCFMEKPAIIRLVHKTGISIDIFVHFHEDDRVWHGSSIHRWDNKRFSLKDYEFLGRCFKGAKDFDLYLNENYGPDWRVPVSDFNVNFDTPNLSFVGTANALVYFSWAIEKSVAGKNPLRVKKYIELLLSLDVVEIRGSAIRVR